MNRRDLIKEGISAIGIMCCFGVGSAIAKKLKLAKIKDGDTFTIDEINADNRFLTAFELGLSMQSNKFFKFRTDTQLFPQLGVIVDQGNIWEPFYVDDDNILVPDENKKPLTLSSCPERLRKHANELRAKKLNLSFL